MLQAVRRPAEGDLAAAKITAEFPGARVSAMRIDLSAPSTVRKFAAEFVSKYGRLNVRT
jgi:NAD(P)-dependent dehydrogenase (short-subunit alcohol dehydrogenase family)